MTKPASKCIDVYGEAMHDIMTRVRHSAAAKLVLSRTPLRFDDLAALQAASWRVL